MVPLPTGSWPHVRPCSALPCCIDPAVRTLAGVPTHARARLLHTLAAACTAAFRYVCCRTRSPLPPLPPPCRLPGAGVAASILWRLLLPAHHARWREALTLVLRLTGLGLGLGVHHVWQLVHSEALPGGPGR